MSSETILTIISVSDSFRAVWPDLAEEIGVSLAMHGPGDVVPRTAGPVVVAAGGEEERGLDVVTAAVAGDRDDVFMVGTRAAHRFAIEAMRRGARDYFALPEDLDLMRRSLSAVCEAERERRSGASNRVRIGFDRLIGESPALRATIDRAERIIVHGDITVLITGETGTGKEVLSRAIHELGPRADAPFVAVNCAAIPDNLLESELFGHERGAFTDAHTTRVGLFEEADGGTLFLDEIGHLPLTLQGKLLRALEEKRVRRVGANQDRGIDVRIMAATHVDLLHAVREGEFRQDLYYRLNVVSLELPPLRERGGDIELLATAFVKTMAARYDLPEPKLTPDLIDALRRHRWPGNVRELHHAIERALVLSPPGELHSAELGLTDSDATPGTIPFPDTLRAITEAVARATLELHGGNKSAAARQLDISRARLQRLLDGEAEQ